MSAYGPFSATEPAPKESVRTAEADSRDSLHMWESSTPYSRGRAMRSLGKLQRPLDRLDAGLLTERIEERVHPQVCQTRVMQSHRRL